MFREGPLELFIDPNEKNPIFCPSNGSLQTIFGLVYAIVTSEPTKKFLFVEKIPYYSFHEHAISFRAYPNARFQGFHEPSEIKINADETLVEFVTSPNNPDGTFRKPFSKADIIIADFVFSSPSYGSDGSGYIKENLAWLRTARSSGKHVFVFNSVSKALGKPGYRLGYMWFPKRDPYASSIFHNFFAYDWKLTVGTATAAVANAMNLISALSAMPNAGQALRTDAYNTIVKRHELVKAELLKHYPGTEVTSIPGSPTLFAKLNSPLLSNMSGKEVMLNDLNVAVDNGNTMGASNEFIRINLCGASGDLAEFLNRLANAKKYNREDLLVSTANHCTKKTIHSSEQKEYVLALDDCHVAVDANDADVKIILPALINYQQSNLVAIKKIDHSRHVITVEATPLRFTLKKNNEQSQLQWSQPFFLNGQWKKVGY